MIKNRFVLIDAFALIHRAFHAIPPLTTKDGQLVNAVYGFASALLTTIKDLQPEYLAVGVDLPKPTKRKAEYAEYKAHRPAPPEALKSQIPFVFQLLQTFNIPTVGAEGYEGEDVIATIIRLTANGSRPTAIKKENSKKPQAVSREPSANLEFIIVTGDTDTFQLIDEQTKVYSMSRGTNQAVIYDADKVKERYGLTPSQFVDFKALKGDASDNIPGVPGIGEKTAANLIVQFGSLDNLYKKIHEKIKISEKVLRLLKENKEQAFLSYKLSKICADAPIDFNLGQAKAHDFDEENVVKLFKELGFKSLIGRLPKSVREDKQQKLF